MNRSFINAYLRSIEIDIVILTMLLYLFRSTVPVLKFPFLLLFTGLIVYTIFRYRRHLFLTSKQFIWHFHLTIILLILFILSFLLSNKLYLAVFKDIINALILIGLFFLLTVFTSSVRDLNKFYKNLIRSIIIFSLFISVILLGNFLNLFNADTGIISNVFSSNSQIGSISSDYNFDLVPAFLGMIGVFYFLIDSRTFLKIGVFNLILIIYSIVIFFSGSRRGFIILTIIISILLFMQVFSFIKKENILKKIASSSKWFLISIIVLTILSWGFAFHTSYYFKKQALSIINAKNPNSTKTKVVNVIFKYNSIINKKISVSDLYEKIWFNGFDKALDPETGWGTKIHKTVFPLTGDNVKIVPHNAVGYLMDSSCNASDLKGNSYSYTLLPGLDTVQKGHIVRTSVFCYVSEDFDGTWVRISAEGDVSGKIIQEYDLNKKGIWQKLQIEFKVNLETPRAYLYWSKYGVTDFSSLKGYVIFAYPKNIIVSKNDSIQSIINPPIKYSSPDFIKSDLKRYDECHLSPNQLSHIDEIKWLKKGILNFDKEYSSINKHKSISNNAYPYQYKAGLVTFYMPELTTLLLNGIEKDPIRKWASSLISEDTTYYGFKSKLHVDIISNKFFGPRIMRWQFAGQIFLNEYNWKQKLFGGGFNFLNWFGFYFLKNKTSSDYPHNPFLSVLLYSGLFGLLIYLLFLYKVIYLYIRYMGEYTVLVIFFIITFFFSFFSAGSPFDPPIMGFFVLLPFFLNLVHKKQNIDKISE